MHIVEERVLWDKGDYQSLSEFKKVKTDFVNAVSRVVWPLGSTDFTINPKKHGNGVKPIKAGFTSYLSGKGWNLEDRNMSNRSKAGSGSRPGAFDCSINFQTHFGTFAIEWETGNISSSHRSIDRLALGIRNSYLSGGYLVVPTKKLADFLTDRIGNEAELEPYTPLWQSMEDVMPTPSFLAIVSIEHEHESETIDCIQKGTDGRALR